MHLEAGSKLGRYEILELAGAGGMGEVYRARDTRLDRDVAIKVLPEAVANDPAWLARFEREARSVSSLNHPRICALFDVGHEKNIGAGADDSPGDGYQVAVHFLVMEYLEGETLAERLETGRLLLADAVRFGSQIADALAAAHRAGVVHRDLKPGNVMLTKTGAKLLDFGVAKPQEAANSTQLTAAPTVTSPLTAHGTIVGTYQYMAPEVLAGGEADARSDIFAFGAFLYEMIAGRSAFGGQTQAILVASILKDEVRPVSAIVPEVPAGLSRLVERCLEKDPERRWQSAADLAMELDWLASGGASSGGSSLPSVSPREATTGSGSSRLAWTLAALFALVSIVIGFGWLRQSEATGSVAAPMIRFELPAPEGTVLRSMYESAAPPVVSPDGRFIVFGVMGAGSGNQLWIRPLDAAARPLPGTEGGMRPFWSPDSRSLGFFTTSEMLRIDIAGGPPTRVAATQGARGGTWNADGTIVYAPDAAGPLYRVSAVGGESAPVTELSGELREASHRYPHFLPNGRHFLFLVLGDQGAGGTGEESLHRLMLGSMDEDTTRLLVRGASNAVYANGHLVFRRGRALRARPFDAEVLEFTGDPITLVDAIQYDASYERAIFSASSDVLAFVDGDFTGETHLQQLDRSGGVTRTLPDDGGIQYESRFDPHGSRLAMRYTSEQGKDAIWVLDPADGTRTRITFEGGVPRSPVWAPDGEAIAYGWTTEAGNSIRVSRIDGGGDPEILAGSWNGHPTAWSPDGRHLVLDRIGGDRRSDIWILDLEEEGGPRPLIEAEHSVSLPAISRDGRWLAYTSNESGRLEVYVTRFPSGQGKWLVSEDGGLDPLWDVEGGGLLYRSLDYAVMAVSISDSGGNVRVSSPEKLFGLFASIDIAESVYDLSPDGQTFVANTFSEDHLSTPITVVSGWERLLEP